MIYKYLNLPDFGKNRDREFRSDDIDCIAVWFTGSMSHNAVLSQVIEKLVEAGFATEQEIKEAWFDLLLADSKKDKTP